MNCKHVNKLLSAYMDGELPGDEMLLIRHHLSECNLCAAEHLNLRKTKLMLSNLRTAVPGEQLYANIVEKLDNAHTSNGRVFADFLVPSLHNRYMKTGLASVLCGLAAIAIYFSSSTTITNAPDFIGHQSHISTEHPMTVFSASAKLPCIPHCMKNDTLMLVEDNSKNDKDISFASSFYGK